ncbi:hypothetical protein GCM10015535_31240 [Streptomyces gelaticus]|uniref:Exo-alpha-sialidase n=1 Tax=Streptomyces gelaticus TaxID=285446 RepID=A0ABQ2W241_9ACTN|nr:hypothetical protein GCM10015535_31240 [Streptomyces gelaticus]
MATRNKAGSHGSERDSRAADLETEHRVLMTLRVSRDSGRSWSRTTSLREGDPFIILSNPGRFPPCQCPRCCDSSAASHSALRPAVAEPEMAQRISHRTCG